MCLIKGCICWGKEFDFELPVHFTYANDYNSVHVELDNDQQTCRSCPCSHYLHSIWLNVHYFTGSSPAHKGHQSITLVNKFTSVKLTVHFTYTK